MDETILFPSPNWFQVSGLAVSSDGWLAYGGPSKSLCVLRPLPADGYGVVEGSQRYTAHVLNRAHPDKIVSVDLSPEWPEKRLILTGSSNGSVKQWSLEEAPHGLKFKSTLSHDIHTNEKEEIVGVAYSNEVYAITVGGYGNIVKWDLNSNVVRTYSNILKTFKPSCLACSHHVTLTVAIGTKQGVLFVVDLTGAGSVLYKVRSQDDEIMNVSWCPQYEVQVEKFLEESKRTGVIAEHPEKPKTKKYSASDRMERIRQQRDPEEKNKSGIKKDLPEDSFDDFEVVQEDDMFDIYKDHEADEFGHKKYEPEDIIVKIKVPEKEQDYLAECLKLKEDILSKKNAEPSIESLVDVLDKTDINREAGLDGASGQTDGASSQTDGTSSQTDGASSQTDGASSQTDGASSQTDDVSQKEAPGSSKETQEESNPVSSVHMHKHLLATIGKQGGVRIWSKTGKLVASCALSGGKQQHGRPRGSWATLAWCRPELLLIADGRSQLLECNPLAADCKNKLATKLVHALHKRGLHCIATNASRRPAPTRPEVWTVAQDRTLARYDMTARATTVHATCGGFVYNAHQCPYDASKIAVSVGDGTVRVWSAEESEQEDGKISAGHVVTYWQHVQGKVLTVAWHPTRENLLAFGTAESRVGVIEAGGCERPARALPATLSGAVYALAWSTHTNKLYAAARGDLVAFDVQRPDELGASVGVVLEGASWAVSAVRARSGLLSVGSDAGGVAVLHETDYTVVAAAFPFNKIIHTVEWHPEQTSFSSDVSPHKNLIAACSQDKSNAIAILEFTPNEEGEASLQVWKTLIGHTGSVLQVAWSPHHEEKLLSTSHDNTVRVWDILSGTCLSIFGGHASTTLGAAWAARPALAACVLSGGADCCLRLWDHTKHPADKYVEIKEEPKKDKKKKKNNEKKTEAAETEPATAEDSSVAATSDSRIKIPKKFLLPTITKQMMRAKTAGARRMLHKYMVKKHVLAALGDSEEYDLDYIKMFGTNKEVNEVFDMEMDSHLQADRLEAWMVLGVFRGHIDAVTQLAAERSLLCPYLLSIAPGVSAKYWKDTSRLYLAQIDRLVANGEEDKLVASRSYGGPVFRKAMTLLSLQDVIAAVKTLCDAKLYKEAYLLCRIRYMDTIAEEVLEAWAKNCMHSGLFDMAAICHLALENLLEAATVLSKCSNEENLALAAEVAQAAGQTILADNLTDRFRMLKTADTASELEQLPTRLELMLRENGTQDNGGSGRDETCDVNGDN